MGNTRLYDKSFNWAIIAEHFLYIDTRWDVHDGTKEIRFSAHIFSLWLILNYIRLDRIFQKYREC